MRRLPRSARCSEPESLIQSFAETNREEEVMNVSQVIQNKGFAGLFSSALFCLWLSTASLVVWVDFGGKTPEAPAKQETVNTAGDARADAA
jgi:hypothetical protein